MTGETELLAAAQKAEDWLVLRARWGRARAAAACGWAAMQLAQRGAELTPQLIVATAKHDENEMRCGLVKRDASHREPRPKISSINKALEVKSDDLDPLQVLEMLEKSLELGEM